MRPSGQWHQHPRAKLTASGRREDTVAHPSARCALPLCPEVGHRGSLGDGPSGSCANAGAIHFSFRGGLNLAVDAEHFPTNFGEINDTLWKFVTVCTLRFWKKNYIKGDSIKGQRTLNRCMTVFFSEEYKLSTLEVRNLNDLTTNAHDLEITTRLFWL